MTCRCTSQSPFRFAEYMRASIFSRDTSFIGSARTGKTASQTSGATVARAIALTGRSPGTLTGISPSADRAAEESVIARRAAKTARQVATTKGARDAS